MNATSRTMSPFLDSLVQKERKQSPKLKLVSNKKRKGLKRARPEAIAALGYNAYYQQLTAGEKWRDGISASGAPTKIDVPKTLQNARSATHQSPQARAIITRAPSIEVDAGLKLEPIPAWDILGITDDAYKQEWVSKRALEFDMYMSSKQCHRSGLMTGYQIQALWSLMGIRDNDQFARFFYSQDKKLMSPVQLQFVDPTLLRGCPEVCTYGQQNWKDGIQRNEKGEEIAYSIWTRVKVGNSWKSEAKEILAKGVRSGRVFMFHGYDLEYPGQGRGFSKLHPTLQDYQSIVDYVAAIVKKAINQGDMVGFVKPSDIASASNPMEGGQGGPLSDPTIAVGIDESDEAFCFYRPEYAKKVPGSDFFANLKAGEEIKFLQDTAPGPQFDAFITSIFKYCVATLGYPAEVILMAFNSNYSASRAALLEAWRTGRIAQANIKADLMDVWYEMWLSEEIAAGRISAPGWNDPRLRQAWMRYRLQGAPLPSISPRDDVAAIETDLKLQLTTQEKAARERHGTDARQNIITNTALFGKSPHPYWDPSFLTVQPSESGQSTGDQNQATARMLLSNHMALLKKFDELENALRNHNSG